ncbi:hypothetical protein ACHAWF_011294 [Thalassiosira exigua]
MNPEQKQQSSELEQDRSSYSLPRLNMEHQAACSGTSLRAQTQRNTGEMCQAASAHQSRSVHTWTRWPDTKRNVAPTERAQSAPPFATPYDCMPSLEASNVSTDYDFASSPARSIDRNRGLVSFEQNRAGCSISIASSGHDMHMHMHEESLTNSPCEPVLGKLADLADARFHSSENDEADDDEGGIVIIESDEECDGSDDVYRDCSVGILFHPAERSAGCTDHEIPQASMYENDPIVKEAVARVTADPILPSNGNSPLDDFEQLLREADDRTIPEDSLPEIEEKDAADAAKGTGRRFWPINPFSYSQRSPETSQYRQQSPHTPVRATRIRHDKYVVEIDIFPSTANNTQLDQDVFDVLSNVELLHLWFDPVPAIFDAIAKDGSAVIMSPPANPIGDQVPNNRQSDGQWVEISTPPLSIPKDSQLSGCFRAIYAGFRSLIGFPVRIRSMIFIERSNRRMGMTLGPFPDGVLCRTGTVANHTFNIRMADEEGGTTDGRRCVVVSDEVQLERGDSNDIGMATKSCFMCSVLRVLVRFLEWTLMFRWCRPDLTSYMQQSITSMSKLRTLVERGESAVYGDSSSDDLESRLLG